MNGVSKRIWLLVYLEGGWWTVAEIRTRLQLAAGSNVLHMILKDMAKAGFLVAHVQPDLQLEKRVRYGVTKKCKVPRGVKLEEIEATLAMGMELKAA